MLTLGDQIWSPEKRRRSLVFGLALYFARASVETTSPTWWSRSMSQVAASPIAWGKTVAIPSRAKP